MTLALVLGALIALLTVWWLTRAVRSETAATQENLEGQLQLRDRLLAQLRELDVEEGDRAVDTGVAADERRRLEAELARVLNDIEARPTSASSPSLRTARSESVGRAVAIVAAVLVPLAAAALYFGQHVPVLKQLTQAEMLARGEVPPMVREMVTRLEQRLAAQPNDPQGWARLGRAYAVLGRPADARTAYAKAVELAPNDAEILGAYAGFLVSLDPSNPSAETVAVFHKLLALDPQHPAALWALGLVAFQERKFAQAVQYWERLQKLLPAQSDVEAELAHALGVARAEIAKQNKKP